jgi:hypothetical protein
VKENLLRRFHFHWFCEYSSVDPRAVGVQVEFRRGFHPLFEHTQSVHTLFRACAFHFLVTCQQPQR